MVENEKEYWYNIIDEAQASDEILIEWLCNHDINIKEFFKWHHIYVHDHRHLFEVKRNMHIEFVELPFTWVEADNA